MSDPNDAWGTTEPAGDAYGDRSPRRDDGGRSPPPPRNRSRSPARNGNGNGNEDRGRGGGGGGGGEVANQGNNLHVSGLAKVVDVRMLEDLFSKYGKVTSTQVMADPHTQESRGFGFVKLELPEQAEEAVTNLNGVTFEGKVLTVAHARRGRARTPTPGRYHGVKVEIGGRGYGGGGDYQDRPYQPRSYDSRYADRGPPRHYDDRRFDDRRYDDRRDYYDRRDYGRERRYDDRGPPPPPADRADRGAYDRREERPRYDERPRY